MTLLKSIAFMLHIILSTQNLSNLRKLDLSGHLIASSLAGFNRQLEKLGHATNLRELIIEGCQVNHTEFLKSLHLLCVLNLSITKITEEDLQYIAHCASLKYLYLSFNPLSEQSILDTVVCLPNLEHLDIFGINLSIEGLYALLQTSLKSLHCSLPRVTGHINVIALARQFGVKITISDL